jgi:hypothetical protein
VLGVFLDDELFSLCDAGRCGSSSLPRRICSPAQIKEAITRSPLPSRARQPSPAIFVTQPSKSVKPRIHDDVSGVEQSRLGQMGDRTATSIGAQDGISKGCLMQSRFDLSRHSGAPERRGAWLEPRLLRALRTQARPEGAPGASQRGQVSIGADRDPSRAMIRNAGSKVDRNRAGSRFDADSQPTNTIRSRRKPRGSPCSISDRVEGCGAACSGVGSITHVRTGDTKR